MQAFMAMIIPIGDGGGGGGGGGGGQPPLGMWGPSDPRPSNPIAGFNPGTGQWPNPPQQPPLGMWGPNDPRPGNPIAGPGRPPGWGMAGDPGYGIPVGPGGGGGPPNVIWGPTDPRPENPIAGFNPGTGTFPDLPTTLPPAQGSGGEPVPVEWKTGWSQQTGWVVVGIPKGPVPTPSGQQK